MVFRLAELWLHLFELEFVPICLHAPRLNEVDMFGGLLGLPRLLSALLLWPRLWPGLLSSPPLFLLLLVLFCLCGLRVIGLPET